MAMNTYYNVSNKLVDGQHSVAGDTSETTGSEVIDTRTLKGTATAVLSFAGATEDTGSGHGVSFTTRIETASDTGFSSDVDTEATFDKVQMDTGDTSVAAQIQSKEIDLAACGRYLRAVTDNGDTAGTPANVSASWAVALNVQDAY